jgi:hypothetical protein
MVASLSTNIRLEEHAAFILFMGFVLILFWYALWCLLEEITETIHKKYQIRKTNIYLIYLLLVVLFVGMFPQILQKI